MNGYRTVVLALWALAMSAGCRTAGLGTLAKPEPLQPRAAATAKELVAELNENAEKVQSFEAAPSITAYFPDGGGGGADGRLAFARPHSFKLVMSLAMQPIADIGSNDDEFWFWMKPKDRKEKKAIYYCKYDEAGESPVGAVLQPDWIVEAFGFRTIPEDEAAAVTVKPGKEPKTLVLNHPAGSSSGLGRSLRRETVISEATHNVLEHRVYSSRNVLLARATIADRDYRRVALGADGQGGAVNLPGKLRLEWFQDDQRKFALDVALNAPKVNTKFDASRRAALFVEPEWKGYERINLAELPATLGKESGTTVRHTRPAPPARVKLEEPSPLGRRDDATVIARHPMALSADLGTFQGEPSPPPIPSAVDPGPVGSDAYNPPPPGFER